MIDLRPPFAVLAKRMPQTLIEATLAPLVAHRGRVGRATEGIDLCAMAPKLAGAGVSVAGWPRFSISRMAGLLYLKHVHNLSDEPVCERWAENNYWQYFCREDYYQLRLPCDPTYLGRLRQALCEAGVEELLATTIAVAVDVKAVAPDEFKRVAVDATVQEKAIAFPSDSCLLDVARAKPIKLAQHAGLALKQTYEHEGKRLRRCAGGYVHAKQNKRLREILKRPRTVLGRRLRDIERKLIAATDTHQTSLTVWLDRAWRIWRQQRKDKNKLYALHSPEVECVLKGKARQPYECGVKASLAITEKCGLIVGTHTFSGNPYDGHTLAEQFEKTRTLLGSVPGGLKPTTVLADLGYRSVEGAIAPVELIHRGKYKSLRATQSKYLKRRQAIKQVQARSRTAVLLAEGRDGRRAARGVLRNRLQPALVATRDRAAGHQTTLVPIRPNYQRCDSSGCCSHHRPLKPFQRTRRQTRIPIVAVRYIRFGIPMNFAY
ncbi:IS5 family transposase [Burkholderia orbicola]|uniref:IS5 family transposase n=1 Tax=Burkholderia orbicola TaxID=2978683 RepID=UPI002FE1D784